jgi:hypothetical protein
MSASLAESEHSIDTLQCPLSGVKRTWRVQCEMSAYDPKRTSIKGEAGEKSVSVRAWPIRGVIHRPFYL